jgi:hypothetical protein
MSRGGGSWASDGFGVQAGVENRAPKQALINARGFPLGVQFGIESLLLNWVGVHVGLGEAQRGG